MKILKNAVAGTLESSDLFIQIEPDEKELTLEIDSVVANQYMDSIRAAVLETLKEFDVSTGKIFIKDKGALDCVIRARMETALKEGEWKRYEKNHAVFTGKHSQYADKWGYSGCRHHHF